MTRVLIITGAELGARMAGPAIRAMAIARVLASDGHHVTLATTSTLDSDTAPQSWDMRALRPGDDRAFSALESSADVIIFQGHAMEQFAALATTDRFVVVDAYDPMHLEMLEQGREQPRATWDLMVRSRVALLNQQLARADYVMCASQRQRSLYIGQLAAIGRVSPATYESDPHLAALIGVVPFGLDAHPPERTAPAMRGVLPGVDDDSRVLLWGGGIYSWFDPLALIRAVHSLAERKPHTKLVFLGTRHPGVDAMGIVAEAFDLATQLGALGTSVLFNEDWVPYDQRGNFLAEADAGVSTHHAHVETEFSFRTRILDYLWAGLPMVVTEGDTFADLVESEQLGIAVPAGDQAALETALERVLYDQDFSLAAGKRVEQVRDLFVWERVLEPLREFVRAPHYAADIAAAGNREAVGAAAVALLAPIDRPGLRRNLRMAWHHLRHGGVGELLRRLKARSARG